MTESDLGEDDAADEVAGQGTPASDMSSLVMVVMVVMLVMVVMDGSPQLTNLTLPPRRCWPRTPGSFENGNWWQKICSPARPDAKGHQSGFYIDSDFFEVTRTNRRNVFLNKDLLLSRPLES